MSKSQQPSTETDLGEIFVAITGDEEVTTSQDDDWDDREHPGDTDIEAAVQDGLEDAIAGAEPDPGDPGG